MSKEEQNMRGNAKIHHRPYYPPTHTEDQKKPYICRLAPWESGFEFEWLDHYCTGAHTLYFGLRGGEEKDARPISEPVVTVDHLEPDREYEFYVESEAGERSNVRRARCPRG